MNNQVTWDGDGGLRSVAFLWGREGEGGGGGEGYRWYPFPSLLKFVVYSDSSPQVNEKYNIPNSRVTRANARHIHFNTRKLAKCLVQTREMSLFKCVRYYWLSCANAVVFVNFFRAKARICWNQIRANARIVTFWFAQTREKYRANARDGFAQTREKVHFNSCKCANGFAQMSEHANGWFAQAREIFLIDSRKRARGLLLIRAKLPQGKKYQE